jgi:hypothetical protein
MAKDQLADRRARTKYSLTQPSPEGRGVDIITRAREEYALWYCTRMGHRIRGGPGNRQGCRPDLQDALMGRLGRRTELPPLPSSGVDPVTRFLDSVLADFGEHDLDGLWRAVNDWRAGEGQDPITQTACAIRLREVREHGRTLEHRPAEGRGSDVYWYLRPNQLSGRNGG